MLAMHRVHRGTDEGGRVHPTDPCRKSKSSVLTKGNISSISGMSQAALVKLRMLEHGWQLRGLGSTSVFGGGKRPQSNLILAASLVPAGHGVGTTCSSPMLSCSYWWAESRAQCTLPAQPFCPCNKTCDSPFRILEIYGNAVKFKTKQKPLGCKTKSHPAAAFACCKSPIRAQGAGQKCRAVPATQLGGTAHPAFGGRRLQLVAWTRPCPDTPLAPRAPLQGICISSWWKAVRVPVRSRARGAGLSTGGTDRQMDSQSPRVFGHARAKSASFEKRCSLLDSRLRAANERDPAANEEQLRGAERELNRDGSQQKGGWSPGTPAWPLCEEQPRRGEHVLRPEVHPTPHYQDTFETNDNIALFQATIFSSFFSSKGRQKVNATPPPTLQEAVLKPPHGFGFSKPTQNLTADLNNALPQVTASLFEQRSPTKLTRSKQLTPAKLVKAVEICLLLSCPQNKQQVNQCWPNAPVQEPMLPFYPRSDISGHLIHPLVNP
ncbi:hypothetical protein Anapl_02460 [Anas platyrhynchos]|uniref:Uncharacterized protein n=1 Tax=Anas platyrhynchos TaxID=8839 RepID=R0K202_ANAPL|nr:hypothetical protein Anapl_02460 [Anas platyrhynchos]